MSYGLALGGGAVLGAAHVGVLRAIEEHRLEISHVSGTSIGAFIAALYAFELPLERIREVVLDLDWLNISSLSLPRLGLFSNEKLGKNLEQAIGRKNIEDATRPLSIMSCDIATGKAVCLQHGDVARAVMASACIPGFFNPVNIDGKMLVDGGLVENVPISPLRKSGCKTILAVDLSSRRHYRMPEDIVDVLTNSLDIAMNTAVQLQLKDADILIETELSAYSRTDTHQLPKLVDEGYQAANKVFSKLAQ